MKKLFLGFFLISTILFSSCKTENSYQSSTFVWYIASMESVTVGQTSPIEKIYTYGQVKLDNVMSKTPMLLAEKITGDTLTKIEYSYTPTTITCLRYAGNGAIYRDSLNLGQYNMAYQTVDQTGAVAPYYITYGSMGMRNKVGDVTLKSSGKIYTEAMKDGQVIAKYTYGDQRNYMRLQQFSIFGSKEYWATDLFGMQSDYLLQSVVVKEDGEPITYHFTYTFDNNGFVTRELIECNGKEYMVNNYAIAGVVITSESEK